MGEKYQEQCECAEKTYRHVLPGEHVYEDVLFFGYTPADILDAVKDFQVRNDDVIIATYPKAGTTWLQEIAWLIMHDGDFDGAYRKPVYFRSPFLEFKDEVLNEVGLDIANPMTSPRVIKSHLPVKLMPKQIHEKDCKIIVLFRNPKDLCVSYYHFYRSSSSFGKFTGTLEDFFDMFMEGHVDHGSWFDYTKSWWELRDRSNVKIIFYEDMKEDLHREVTEICKFLDKDLSGDLLTRIVEHCQFESMKRNPMTNHLDVYSINAKVSPLLRKGTVGDWKTHFTVSQNERFDKFYNDVLGGLDIPFKYTLEMNS
ncbi:sulfotransferase 1E1-like [Ruditapes philippinarum]|uniref:sulfotransferase 1E1-like n=1 Tax=Ruditapes philippinarum TaxID=129788 RepID=UPI00295B86EB|nr:sulfotransferase 1E1-like [Ruditapes philippinarum]